MSSGDMPTIQPALSLIFPSIDSGSEYKEELEPHAAWHFFSHSVGRNPTDLTMHTHRIFFAIKHQNAEYLPGALHDLFYILKDAGQNLRLRLLKVSAPHLNEDDKKYYATWLKTGEKSGMNYKWVKGSVLSQGLFDCEKALITKHSDKGSVNLSPIEEARSCMEYGQLEVAQKILEAALETEPNNVQLTEELALVNSYSRTPQESQNNQAHKMKNNKSTKVGFIERIQHIKTNLFIKKDTRHIDS
ncbi:MAG: tetratricopeptide repeat protein [Cocleimonas sp.]|nr:tetratricopeptide repeat protein [Cocleimonas sp.]